MSVDSSYMIFFSANLAFIVTHLYGWLLKRFFRPEAYRVGKQRFAFSRRF